MTLLEEPSPRRRSLLLEPVASPTSSPARRRAELVERGGWSLVWLGVITGGLGVWGYWVASPVNVVLAPAVVLIGILGMAAVWWIPSVRSRLFQAATLLGVLASVMIPRGIGIHVRQYYTTDSAAFDHVAAQALLHGADPYTTSMSAAGELLNVPALFWTYTVNGTHVSHVSYPAGSFLVDVPALALGFLHLPVDWTDLIAWLITGALLFVLLPSWLRWLGGLVILSPIFSAAFSAGGTDAAFLPFLVLAVWRWDRFGRGREAGLARWMGPVALGLACAVKQTPWFCVPFLALGVALEARRDGRRPVRVLLRYLNVVVAVFTVVNLPFIVWQPQAWAHGTLIPFMEPLVADGQGLVSLATHGFAGGVNLSLLAWAAGLAYLTVLGAFVLRYRSFKRVWLLLLPVAFFFSARSLANYLVDLFPAAVVAMTTVASPGPVPARPPSTDRRHVPTRVLPLVAGVVGVVVLSVVAFTGPTLQLSVKDVYRSEAGGFMGSVVVSVHNNTGTTLTPSFLVDTGDSHPAGFWFRADGRPVVVGPHSSVTVRLRPPTDIDQPTIGTLWLVEAYVAHPDSLSSSPLQTWKGWTLTP
ncbi:MAG: hypothetical protein ACRDY1_00830 [Acidimicrobiales bacterium]